MHPAHAVADGQPPPLIHASDQKAVSARIVIRDRQAAIAAAARQKKKKNSVGLLGLGLKVGFAILGADLAIDGLIGGGGGGGGGGGVSFGGVGPMPDFGTPSVPDFSTPNAFSGPVDSEATDGIQ